MLAHSGAPELVVLDTMTHWIQDRADDLRLLMRSADVVLLNEDEALVLGEGDQAAGIRPILEDGCSWVVVKRGDQGAIAFGHDRAIAVSAPRPREVKDPTGAGDAFAGGLVARLARDWPSPLAMDEALRQAVAMGSLAVESFSVDRLLSATVGGVASRAREAGLKMRKHRLFLGSLQIHPQLGHRKTRVRQQPLFSHMRQGKRRILTSPSRGRRVGRGGFDRGDEMTPWRH